MRLPYGSSVIVCVFFLICIILGFLIGSNNTNAQIAIVLLLGSIGMVIALVRPHIGLAVISGLLPIVHVFPPNLYTIATVGVGAVLILAYLARLREHTGQLISPIELCALVFLLWMFFSAPGGISLSGEDRSWILTFLQLWFLMWLTRVTFRTQNQHEMLFWLFCLTATASATIAIVNGGPSPNIDNRQAGLSDAINAAARYFTVALVFLYYLYSHSHNWLIKALLISAMVIVIAGTVYTVSRTGLLLLLLVIAALFLTPFVLFKEHNLRGSQRLLVGVALLVALLASAFSNYIFATVESSIKSVQSQSDTVGIRFGLWEAGFRMLQAYPITGVGIGQYPARLFNYGSDLLEPRYLVNSGPHNMYVQVLAETGLVGFGLFTAIVSMSTINLVRGVLRRDSLAPLALCWLIVLLVILIGGLTKDDSYEKLLWVCIGASSWVMEAKKQLT